MSDLSKNTPISKFNSTDPAYIKAQAAEITHRHHDDPKWVNFKGKNFQSLKLLYAYVMNLLEDKSQNPSSVDISHLSSGEKEFYNLLSAFSNLLAELSATDKSKDNKFLKELSKNWNFILLSTKRRENLKPACSYFDLLETTLHSIHDHGPEETQPLGYYLESHKQQDWFPIPYLKMLFQLHQDHAANKTESLLSTWRDLISLILVQIRSTK
jgi:hypothetical protein